MLNFSEIIQLKQELAERYQTELHYHDVCPKPFFTMEQTSGDIQDYISGFLQKRHYAPCFSDDGLQFTIKRSL